MAAEPIRHLPNLLFGLLGACLFGFAAGAVWMVPTMMFGRALPALALPLGWLLGLVVRRWLRFSGITGAALAALSALLAALYVSCLVQAAVIAGLMGMGFGQAIVDAGPGMLLELARLSLGGGEYALYLAGAVLAAVAAFPVRVGRRG